MNIKVYAPRIVHNNATSLKIKQEDVGREREKERERELRETVVCTLSLPPLGMSH